jgi:hypothetical protein
MRSLSTTVFTLAALVCAPAFGAGPGVGSLSYTPAEVGQPVAVFNAALGAEGGTNVPLLVNGYLMLHFAPDSGNPGNGIAIYDISDPKAPQLVKSVKDEHTATLRETHALPIARVAGRDVVVMQAVNGIQFWDLTDPLEPTFLSELALEGANGGDYTNAAWWTSWQGRWVFVAGVNNGTYVVDAVDPLAPVFVKRVPSAETGGFLVGPIFAMGDRLVMSDTNGLILWRYALLDIVDPASPFLVNKLEGTLMQLYASTVLGDRIYGMGRGNHMHVVSWENDTLTMLTDMPSMGPASYGSVQDQTLHYGGKEYYQKVDITDELAPVVVNKIQLAQADTDHGQAWAFGNLVYIGNDHGTGSVLAPHAAEPDTNPPAIVRTYPANGTTHVAGSSRISISFSDNIDFATVGPDSIQIASVGGGPVTGIYSYWSNTVHFGPDTAWSANTEYQVTIKAGGVRDVVGNPVAADSVVTFSTGEGPAGFGGATGSGGSTATGGSAGESSGGASADSAEDDGGCGCELPGRRSPLPAGAFAALALFVAAQIRRRR